jgi:hypothetical protein
MMGIIILIISLTFLVWGLIDLGRTIQNVPITPSDMQLPDTGVFLVSLGWVF